MLYNLADWTPPELGLPPHFTDFRDLQIEAIEAICNTPKRAFLGSMPTGFGKSLVVAATAKALGMRTVVVTASKALQKQYCVVPRTQILRSDLRWVDAAAISRGDILVGFDEFCSPNRRMWQPSKVLNVRRLSRPCYKLTLSNGDVTTCSEDHKWLSRSGGSPKWIETRYLKDPASSYYGIYRGSRLSKLLDVWDTSEDYEGGYLAAAFDGEGHLHQRPSHKNTNGCAVKLSMAQRPNAMYSKVRELLKMEGIAYTLGNNDVNTNDCRTIHISQRRDVFKFLGKYRPARLLPKLDLHLMGMIGPIQDVEIVRKEYVGIKEVIAIATSTRTFVADGYASHNCDDFEQIGMVDIRGKNNYPCGHLADSTCKQGAHSGCPLVKGGGCTYETARDEARASELVVTNYAYWVRSLEYPDRGLHSPDCPVEMLVLDEGHRSVEELSKCLQKSLRETWLTTARIKDYPKESEEITEWVRWATANTEHVEAIRREVSRLYRQAKSPLRLTQLTQLEDLQESLDSICRMDSNRWICEQRKGTQYGRVWDFHPIWPAQFAERYLFGGIEKLVIVSATLRPMTAGMLGLSKDDYEFREWPRIFPPQFAPVYHYCPGPVTRLKFNSSDEDLKRWLGRIDDILEQRNDRKGIIHTVSYARQQYLLANSRWQHRFIANTSDPDSPSALEVVQTHKASREPTVLVSPSLGTGWDFPGSTAEFCIIAKIPFPEMKSKLMKARMEKNKRYPMYLAIQELVQGAGRINRTPEDRGEVFIVDDSITWFWYQNRSLAPGWFNYRAIKELPIPPPSELVTKSL